jgi:predicted aspartyl protease
VKPKNSGCLAALVLVLPVLTMIVSPLQALPAREPYGCESCVVEVQDENTVPKAELPFRLSEGYLIQVEGQIGVRDHLRLILDTGASMSVVDRRIAEALDVKRQPAESFNFDRKLNWDQATIPDIRFGPIEAKNIVVLVGDMAKYSEFARNADAIIGLDILGLSNFTVDYGRRKLIFNTPIDLPTQTRVAAPPNCLILKIHVQGHTVRLIVDTGFPGILLFEERLRTSVPAIRMTRDILNVTLGKRLLAKRTILENVAIGSERRNVTVLLTKAPAAETLPGIDGVIGISALSAHRVHFDFTTQTLSWE